MTTIKKILVPFDNNLRSIAALEYAAMFASGIGANITALHLADPKYFHSIEEFQTNMKEFVNEELRPKLKEIQSTYPDIQKIDLQIRGLEKPIHQHIIEFEAENNIDFIVLRSHGLPEKENWEDHFKSTTAYHVVLEASCPVCTFTKNPEKPDLKNILVPMDLSEGSIYKIPFAVKLAQQFNATIHLVSASEHKDDYEELNQLLDDIEADLQPKNLVVRHSVYHSTIPEAINYYTDMLDIDLVIIMNRPGFRWSDLWVSPKAKRIISHSKVPVISIRSNKQVDI